MRRILQIEKTFIHRGEGRDGLQPPTDLRNSVHHTKAELYFFHLLKRKILVPPR